MNANERKWFERAWLESRKSAVSGHRNKVMTTRFSSPLIKPDVPISSIRLSDGLHAQHTSRATNSGFVQSQNTEFSRDHLGGKPVRSTTSITLVSPPEK